MTAAGVLGLSWEERALRFLLVYSERETLTYMPLSALAVDLGGENPS